jgi:hypothetical protein
MSEVNKERVEREKRRREVANAQLREKVAEARKAGICRCGGTLDFKKGTSRYYSTCPECRAKAKRYYLEGPNPPQKRPTVKLDRNLRECPGVRRKLERDGLGREAWWWFASSTVNGRQRIRRWSVDKYGDRGAWIMAMAQRMDWEESK